MELDCVAVPGLAEAVDRAEVAKAVQALEVVAVAVRVAALVQALAVGAAQALTAPAKNPVPTQVKDSCRLVWRRYVLGLLF